MEILSIFGWKGSKVFGFDQCETLYDQSEHEMKTTNRVCEEKQCRTTKPKRKAKIKEPNTPKWHRPMYIACGF